MGAPLLTLLHLISPPRRFSAFSVHQLTERYQIGSLPPFGEKRGSCQGGELLSHGGHHELVDARSIFFGNPRDGGFE